MKNELTLVIGASGTVGSGIVKQLKAQGYAVRSVTSQTPKDASQVQVNLVTGEGLRAAFEGVDKAFILSPPPNADQYKILTPLIQEAKRRGLKKVVLMTAWGVNADPTSPFRRAEIELEKSGLTYNIIRPNWFMQNFNTFWIQGIKQHGKIMLPAGAAKTSFIHADDISAVAVKLLTTSAFDNKDLDLSGPESIDHAQVAKALTEVTGRKIEYVDITPEDFKKGLVSAGVPGDYAELLKTIIGFLKAGYSAAISPNVKNILGREPKSFMEYAQVTKDQWL